MYGNFWELTDTSSIRALVYYQTEQCSWYIMVHAENEAFSQHKKAAIYDQVFLPIFTISITFPMQMDFNLPKFFQPNFLQSLFVKVFNHQCFYCMVYMCSYIKLTTSNYKHYNIATHAKTHIHYTCQHTYIHVHRTNGFVLTIIVLNGHHHRVLLPHHYLLNISCNN